MAVKRVVQSNWDLKLGCRTHSLYMSDRCTAEPMSLVAYPPFKYSDIVAPVFVAANKDELTPDKINIVKDTAVTETVFPDPSAEGQVVVILNQNPIPLKVFKTAVDTVPVVTLRGGAQTTFRFVGGSWQPF